MMMMSAPCIYFLQRVFKFLLSRTFQDNFQLFDLSPVSSHSLYHVATSVCELRQSFTGTLLAEVWLRMTQTALRGGRGWGPLLITNLLLFSIYILFTISVRNVGEKARQSYICPISRRKAYVSWWPKPDNQHLGLPTVKTGDANFNCFSWICCHQLYYSLCRLLASACASLAVQFLQTFGACMRVRVVWRLQMSML